MKIITPKYNMPQEVIRQLKALRSTEANPSEAWVQNTREVLLSQIKNTVSAESQMPKKLFWLPLNSIWNALSSFLPPSFVYNVLRPVAISVLVVLVGASGWIATVDASYNALPGDLLYSTKRAAEKTQVAIAVVVGDTKTEAKLHGEFAKRRAFETKKIVTGTDPQKMAKAGVLLSDLKNEIVAVNNKLDEIKQGSGDSAPAQTAKVAHDDSEQIKETLKQVKDTLSTSASTENNLTREIASAKEMAKDTAIKAVEVMTVKHLEGDQSVSKEEVTDVIGRQLESTASEVVESAQNALETKAVLEAAKTEVKEFAADNRIGTPAVVSSTKALVNKVNEIAVKANKAAVKSEQVSADANKQIQSAQELLSSGELMKAIDKVKEANDATRQVEAISDNTLRAVQTVIPVMSVVTEPTIAATSSASIVIVVTTTAQSIGPSTTPPLMIIVSTTPVTR